MSLPFFRARWNERYGWRVAGALTLLAVCLYVFADLAEDTSTNDAIVGWDTRFNQWLHHESTPGLASFFRLLTQLGGTICLSVLAVVACALLLRRGRRTDALLVALAYAGSEILTAVFKNTFERERPPFHDPALSFSTFSFPSGHSSVSAAVYGALAIVVIRSLRHRRAQILTVAVTAALVLAIGFSRIYLGAHYLSDVLAGLSLGLAWLTICVVALTVREARRA
jgi:membrane-associated phospholipid phosphatase